MNLRDRMKARVAERVDARQWYEIKNLDESKGVVRIYDEIGYWGVDAAQFARDVAALDVDEIEVQINSPGGQVFDGIAIYNTLRAHPAKVTTRIDGLAASIASVIAQAGDHRTIMQSAQMMIHEAWGVAIGPAAELREFADLIEQQNEVLVGIYSSRSGRDPEEFRALLAAETWLQDEAAVELGLADEVLVPEPQNAVTRTIQATAAGNITVHLPDEPADDPAPEPTPEPSPSLALDEEFNALQAKRFV